MHEVLIITLEPWDRVENRASWWSSGIGRQHIGLFIWSRKDEDFIKDVYFARI